MERVCRKGIIILFILVCTCFSIFADGWVSNVVQPKASVTVNVAIDANVKYFPYAKKVLGLENAIFYTLRGFSFGIDGAYAITSNFALGLDATGHLMQYPNLLDDRIHLAIETFADIRLFWGKGVSTFPVFTMSLLLGAGVYTNFKITNVVPGAGLKFILDFYSRSRFVWGIFARTSAFVFPHSDEHYFCYDGNCSVGLRFGWGGLE